MIDFLAQVTAVEWGVVALATSTCLLGALLPAIGNLLGGLFLGEDPLLERWKHARALRRLEVRAVRQQRRDAKRAAKAAKAAGKGLRR
ncbi:MAG: hypothetical protein EXR79_09000 [Myxococcales bacterium]|nr:hypothetical protein [Myxococcales bacterium]